MNVIEYLAKGYNVSPEYIISNILDFRDDLYDLEVKE